jgi:hypothetical protein
MIAFQNLYCVPLDPLSFALAPTISRWIRPFATYLDNPWLFGARARHAPPRLG